MRATTVMGLILILLGGIALAFGGFTYAEQEHSVDLGPVEFQATEQDRIPIPPAASVVLLIGGVGLVAYSALSNRGNAG